MIMAKILIVGINFFPEPTGIGKYTGEMATYLGANGDAVRVITAPPYYPQWKVSHGYKAGRYQKETWNGIRIWRCPLWVPRKTSGIKRLVHLASFAFTSFFPLMSQLTWKPDVVICIAPALMSAPGVLFFSWLSKAKSHLHIQDFELDAAARLGLLPGGKAVQNVASKVEKWLLSGFDSVSTISNRMMDLLGEKGVAEHKQVFFPNWVDTGFIHPLTGENTMRTEIGVPDDAVIVLYAGSIGQKQGLETVIQSARLLQSEERIQFIIAGEGPGKASLQRMAEGLQNTRFLPVQPLEKLNQLLNLADIHVLPQRAGAADLVMPSKLTGMLASGKAVIAAADAGTELASVVEQVGLLVKPDDVESFVEGINQLAKDPQQRKKMGEIGRDFAENNWGTEKVLGEFRQNLSHMINS